MPTLGKITVGIGRFAGGRRTHNAPSPPSPTTHPPTTTTTIESAAPQVVEGGTLNLINYTPEQLMQHVERTLSTVHFGMSPQHRFKEIVAELWSVCGPLFLFSGTSGEVFFFIWKNTADTTAWWVALSVLVTVAVLECTFMVISYKSDTLRNELKLKPNGGTDEDKRDMATHRRFWYILACGVAVGQISFLVFSMMAKLQNLPFLIVFALGRSVFTLAGDYYTAFVHRAAPTTGERAKMKLKQQANVTADLLRQKTEEVTIMNTGTIDLQRAHTKAQIEQDSLKTELEVARLENKNRIDSMKALQEQATMFTRLGSSMMRALFDPEMPDEHRDRLLSTMQGFMQVGKLLPKSLIVEEEEL